jgi:hypothetical protein
MDDGWQTSSWEIQPEGDPVFAAIQKHLIPVLEIPRFQPGSRIKVRYYHKDRTKVAIT